MIEPGEGFLLPSRRVLGGGGEGGEEWLWIKLIPALIVRPLSSMSTDLAFGELFK